MNTDEIMRLFPSRENVPDAHRISGRLVQEEYLIHGSLRKWAGPMQEVHSPIGFVEGGRFVRYPIGAYPLLTEREAEEALDSAVKAYDSGRGTWPTMPVKARIDHVVSFLNQVRKRRDEVVNLLMWEIGKSLEDSIKEFDRTIEYVEATIEALKDLDRNSSRFVIEQGIVGQIRRAPLGVVLCMGPYNYPLNETWTTLIPALLMGNTVIFKPPRYGVLLHRPMLEAFRDSFPPGVVNTLYGDGQRVIGPLMQSGRIDALAFIGSSRVANLLQKQHPKPHRCRFVLGLEAKNASIILPDADLSMAIRENLLGALSFNGQRCTALKILFVHQRILEPFLAGMCRELENLRCGMPWDPRVQITPLAEEGKPEALAALVEDAVSRGARVINRGGGSIGGSFFFPALVSPVDSRMRLYREEQFGPVIPIVPYEDIEEPIQYIICSDYGQQASLFGSDAGSIARLLDPLVNQVCRVNLNSQCQRGPDTFPFTGRKDSAEGTLSVSDALKVFSIRTLVAAKRTEENVRIINEILKSRESNFLSTDFIL